MWIVLKCPKRNQNTTITAVSYTHLSTDSFPLYVYDADALKVQNDKGETISKLTMDNTSKVSGSLPTVTCLLYTS